VPVVNKLLRARVIAPDDAFFAPEHAAGGGPALLPPPALAGEPGGAAAAAAAAGGLLPVQMLALEQAEAAAAAWLREEGESEEEVDVGLVSAEGRGAALRPSAFGSAFQLAASQQAGVGALAAATGGGHMPGGLRPQGSLSRRAQRFSSWPSQQVPALLSLQGSLKAQSSSGSAPPPPAQAKAAPLTTRAAAAATRPSPAAFAAAGSAAVSRLARAWAALTLGGGLRNSLRALALAVPRLLPALTRGGGPLLALLPAAAGLDLLGSAVIAWAVPRNFPLGSQWVLTHDGLLPQGRSLGAFRRDASSLNLEELGGLFPAHRMISYRNRVAHLAAATPGAGEAVLAPPARGAAAMAVF
jgi:hypothetical protein